MTRTADLRRRSHPVGDQHENQHADQDPEYDWSAPTRERSPHGTAVILVGHGPELVDGCLVLVQR
jgi:hypothetical protein